MHNQKLDGGLTMQPGALNVVYVQSCTAAQLYTAAVYNMLIEMHLHSRSLDLALGRMHIQCWQEHLAAGD